MYHFIATNGLQLYKVPEEHLPIGQASLRAQYIADVGGMCSRCYYSLMSLFAPIFSFIFVLPRLSYAFHRRMVLRRRSLISELIYAIFDI
jgi:hypothetical protein